MKFIEAVSSFFKSPAPSSRQIAVHKALSDASDAYDKASTTTQRYTNLANHRNAIYSATTTAYEGQYGDYDEAIATYTHPDDLKAYTESDLGAHTAVMDALTTAFDALGAAFAVFDPSDDLYADAAALYNAYCDTYSHAAEAYSKAGFCAVADALEGRSEAIKEEFELMVLEATAANPSVADPMAAKAATAAFKAKTTGNTTKAEALEKTARDAKTQAEKYLAKARSAKSKAEKALQNQ